MTKHTGHILVIDDNEDVLTAARLFLKQHYQMVSTERDPNRIPDHLRNEQYDVIMLDMNFTEDVTSGEEGLQWLERILDIDPGAVVVMITAFGDVDLAVKAIKKGATEFVQKPWQNEKLLATINSAINLSLSRMEVSRLRDRQQQLSADMDLRFHEMIGTCSAMQKVFDTIEKVARTDANVLIMGENGTGKELVARAVHRQSCRSDEVFISVDLGAIVPTLFESELFGHRKGAFTDAKEDRTGRFEIASGGTLFLDEIGNIPPGSQAKLLRVLETRLIEPLGAVRPRNIDIRLICATNMPLKEMIMRNEFRQDLLYRMNTVEIHLPPLRDRGEDIPVLAEHFLGIYSRKYKKPIKRLSPAALNLLQRYRWPGNIRELRHALERAVILADNPVLQPADFQFHQIKSAEDSLSFETYNLEEVEKAVIRKVMNKYDGNITHVARELGLTRTSLYRRMEKYDL